MNLNFLQANQLNAKTEYLYLKNQNTLQSIYEFQIELIIKVLLHFNLFILQEQKQEQTAVIIIDFCLLFCQLLFDIEIIYAKTFKLYLINYQKQTRTIYLIQVLQASIIQKTIIIIKYQKNTFLKTESKFFFSNTIQQTLIEVIIATRNKSINHHHHHCKQKLER
ncbi:hypothetical protein TTHERM_000703949 (macronuclear) [Tetrahymena thermophila SB210]|uniref:Uncharacterized protein n=1 Tax=Tetrahymena thermophila (strain SB210) TaxID=312017 RepID=W7X6H3_TETTS|nr:hypothetical protein TTHERM_000703949 [Tetrahymena thermophila SB210]EWS71958.1 hypothetical protein TTHERM_000703949 [Tetrahymena thermophila SB210]|eukprot:XP_012655518.1 hypothetical protein TTHERM_000703949 [Tetrahymena thermophila SB210]